MMKIRILEENYTVLDTKEKITIADSFVVRSNKIGNGNGEKKLYIGQRSEEMRGFFNHSESSISCFLLKKDLLQYLNETKVEYMHPEQPYKNKDALAPLWAKRLEKIKLLPDKVEFQVRDESQIIGPRMYVKSDSDAYNLMRELSLPNITYISIVKLKGDYDVCNYYFRLFTDYFGDIQHPFIALQEEKEIDNISNISKKYTFSRARIGQGKYRDGLLALCPLCPITMVSDERLLIASHIKPWAESNAKEKIDPYNGFMLTPTFDRLFDRGFMTFSEDKRAILSPFLSNMTYSKIGISPNKKLSHLAVEGREDYLQYHRSEIFKGTVA